MNRNKTIGIFLALVGLCCARLDFFVPFPTEDIFFLVVKAIGTALALSGLYVFAAGMKVTTKRLRICSECKAVNSAVATVCSCCNKPLQLNQCPDRQ